MKDMGRYPNHSMYPYEPLDMMYPEVYYRVYPMVKEMCEMYDNPSNPDMYPYPTRDGVEGMAENIYHNLMNHMAITGEIQQLRPFLRTLITILLIRELLRRRGSF